MVKAPRVAVVVTTYRPGRYVDECLASLQHQTYPDLQVVVVDASEVHDEVAGAVELVAPGTRVLTMPGAGYAACANAGAACVSDAAFLLFLHDDAALAPSAIAAMVEVAYAANAGIVTPKIVAFDDPRSLVTVGWDLDAFANPSARVESGELDQGQLDEVVDVDAAPGAAMLVRRDLFEALGGFDEAFELIGEDIDLSVRARRAGARIVSAPHAKVRHRGVRHERTRRARRRRSVGAAIVEERVGLAEAERLWRKRRASRLIIESVYAMPTRALVLVAFVLERLAEALWRFARGSPSAAWASLRAIGGTRADRATARRRRAALDHPIRSPRELGRRWWAPIEQVKVASLPDREHAEERAATPPRRLRRWVPLRAAARWLLAAAVVLSVVSVRGALFAQAPGGSLLGGQSGVTLVARWAAAHAGSAVLGSAVAPLGSLMIGLGSLVVGGDVGLAVRLVVLAAAVGGPALAYRLARRDFDEVRAAVVAFLWAVGPGLGLGIARASLSLIVAYALVPALVGAWVAATQGQRLSPRNARRSLRRLGLVAAATLAFAPQLFVVWLGVLVLEGGVWWRRGDVYRLRRLARVAAVALGTAVGINLPWVAALVVWHPPVSIVFHGQVGASAQSLGGHLFGAGFLVGPAPWLALLSAVVGLAAWWGADERARIARARALTAFGLAGLGAALELGIFGGAPLQPAYPELLGALLALLAAPIGVDVVRRGLSRRRLGLLHLGAGVGAVVGAVLVVAASLSALIAPATPVVLPEASLALAGGFLPRPLPVLWVEVGQGGPLHGEHLGSAITVAVTSTSQPTFLDEFGPPVTGGYRIPAQLVLDALRGNTVELGRTLKSEGIGEVVVLSTGSSPLTQAVVLSFERQVDVRQLLGTPGLLIAATGGVPRRVLPVRPPTWFVVSELVAAGVMLWSLGGWDLLRRLRRRRSSPGNPSTREVAPVVGVGL